MTPFQVQDGLTRGQAKKVVKRAGAGWIQERSTVARHIYFAPASGAWIAYEASAVLPGRFRLSFYYACPCGAAG